MLDEVDRRIVAALQVNGRAPLGAVAQVTGEHERTVARRLTRMLSRGQLRFTAFSDEPQHGEGQLVYLQLRAARGLTNSISESLAARDDTRTVLATTGPWQLLVELIVPDSEDLYETLESVQSMSGVEALESTVTLRRFATVADWRPIRLGAEAQTVLHPELADGRDEGGELDDLDKVIMVLLRVDGRMSYAAISARTGVTPSTARRRTGRLIRTGGVKICTEVEPSLLGFTSEAILWLRLRPGDIATFGSRMAEQRWVRSCSAVAGRCDITLAVSIPKHADLYRFIHETVASSGNVINCESCLVVSVWKRDFRRRVAGRRSPLEDLNRPCGDTPTVRCVSDAWPSVDRPSP